VADAGRGGRSLFVVQTLNLARRNIAVPTFASAKINNYSRCRKFKGIISLPRRKVRIEKMSDIDG
jgi:hypothetical protein